tara:strand:- start:7853 stop:8224 length:372 start_codon:yes stop_codon:yes gene_type:complete
MPDKTGDNRLNNGQFAKGTSGNPNGRPKGSLSIPDMLRRIGEEDVPKELKERVKKLFNSAELGEITMMEAIMRTTMMYAIQGKSWAVQFIADRMEGKPRQTIELEQHEPIQLIKTGIDNFDNG